MEVFKEPIHYLNSHLRIKVLDESNSRKENKSTPIWHYHKEIELVLVQKGTHEIHTVKQCYRLSPGDLVIVGSSQLHHGHKVGDDEMQCIILHFDLQPYFDPAMMMYYRHFSEIHHPLEELNYIFEEQPVVKKEVAQIIFDIRRELLDSTPGFEIAASMHMKHLMLTLLRADRRGLLQPTGWGDPEVLRKIIEYVDQHLSTKMNVEHVSSLAGMSYSYFSKFFKKSTGSSFTDYVNLRRIRNAERLLVTSESSVMAIAESVGIENKAHFYELFKRYNGCTPKEYLRKLQLYRS